MAPSSQITSESDGVVVLCLHGNRQNGKVFRRFCQVLERKGAAALQKGVPVLRKGFVQKARFVFMDALYPITEKDEPLAAPLRPPQARPLDRTTTNGAVEATPRQWWPRPLDLADIGEVAMTDSLRTECTPALDAIDRAIAQSGATVLLGFSQGACAAVTYMEERQDARIVRVVACCGYQWRRRAEEAAEDYAKEEESPWQVKHASLLNIVSEQDETVPAKYAATRFTEVHTMLHDKGHKMVTKSADATRVVNFCCGKVEDEARI